jgi:hypothetical protein
MTWRNRQQPISIGVGFAPTRAVLCRAAWARRNARRAETAKSWPPLPNSGVPGSRDKSARPGAPALWPPCFDSKSSIESLKMQRR